MGVITSGFWLAAGFGLGVAFKENGGKIDWEGGERLLRQQVKLLPERFEDALRLAKACGPSLAGAASSALVVPKEEERERK